MPSLKVHRTVGFVAGGAAALVVARGQPLGYRLLETVGGMLSGSLAAHLPDVLEPAVSSFHRGACHSFATGASAVFVGAETVAQASLRPIDFLRRRSVELFAESAVERDAPRALLLLLAAIGARMLAGAVAGGIAGYASHLVLDAATPRSLPLLFNGM